MTAQASSKHVEALNCPPRFWLEAFFAKESVSPDLRTHFDRCDHCQGALQRLKAESSVYLLRHPLSGDGFKRVDLAAGKWSRRWLASFAIPVAAALMWVAMPTSSVRLKGQHLRVLYRRAGLTRSYEPNVRLRSGDALRFVYSAPSDGSLLVLDVDATRSLQPFVPFDGTHSISVKAGQNLLPDSVALDGTPGPERLVAIFRPEAFSLDWVKDRLVLLGEARPPEIRCGDCDVEILNLQKEP